MEPKDLANLCELLIVAAAILLALFHGGALDRWIRKTWRILTVLARRRTGTVIAIGLLGLGLRAAILPVHPVPAPAVHDEFSYLLQADTFASGRLTNPTHPMWVHFETLHVIHQPTYQSKYPPGQGLILALGQAVAGHPWFGALLSGALMCAAFCWMLQGWLPPRWALLGGLICLTRIGVYGYWVSSYWGGAVGAMGGALVVGALPRVMKSHRVRDGLLMAVGVAILANSRPYEGLLLALPAGVVFMVWLLGKGRRGRIWCRVVLPASCVMVLTALFMGYYFWRVTGDPLKMPYRVHMETYEVAQPFLWQSAKQEPTYRHQVLHDYWASWHCKKYARMDTAEGYLNEVAWKVKEIWGFFFKPALTLPLIFLPWAVRDRRMRIPLMIALVSGLGVFLERPFRPHYIAPQTGLLYMFIMQGMRHLFVFRWKGRPVGMAMALAVPIILMIMIGGFAAYSAWSPGKGYRDFVQMGFERERIMDDLKSQVGKDLVIVRYGPSHNIHREWVYNEADIDAADVVWAREMKPSANQALMDNFKGRRVWLLEPDSREPVCPVPHPRR
jgi:hypothetical protein